MKKIILLLLVSLLITACGEPELFGMPESQFNSLNDEQKQEVIRAYNDREMQRTLNEPVNRLIGVAGSAIGQKKVPTSHSISESCHWEGTTRVCNRTESGSHVGFGISNKYR